MPRICKDLPSTQTSAFILADTSRDVITEYTIPQMSFFFLFGTNLTAESVLSAGRFSIKRKPYPVRLQGRSLHIPAHWTA